MLKQMFITFMVLFPGINTKAAVSDPLFLAGNFDHPVSVKPPHALTVIDFVDVKRIDALYKAEVKAIFERTCSSCHDSQGAFPGYLQVDVIKSFLGHDHKTALKQLRISRDFPLDRFYQGELKKQLLAIKHAVSNESMPPIDFQIWRWPQRLMDKERKIIKDWADRTLAVLEPSQQ